MADTVGTMGSTGPDDRTDASRDSWQSPIPLATATGLAMVVLLASGCASQPNHGPNGSTDKADKAQEAAKLLDDAQRRNNLPYDPIETIDTLSGMHPRAIEAVIQAVAQLGTPYQWGGESAEKGFDCSGLTQHAFKAASIELPRTSAQQYRATQRIERESLRPGDLVFFRLDGKRVDHVGLYVGGDRFIHAPSSGKTVSFASLDNAYWSRKYVGGGRAAEANELQLAGNRPEDF
ncbi:MAG: C40 family peptidase [Guyparkeria sp.]